MATNKNAQIRYHALDRCLGNWSKRFYIEDLIKACNDALYNYNGSEGVKKRQVQADLNFLESEEGYKMLIDRERDGHRVYYRYHHRNASIKKQPINQEELDLIHDALMVMKRLEGVPQLEWIEELEKRLYTTSKLHDRVESVVSFQHNPYLKGMKDFYKTIFDAIINKRVIEIVYHPFSRDARTLLVNPYHLKQYNNRWFLIGKHDGTEYLSNFAIDRIESCKETSKPFTPITEDVDFSEYFADVVGVSITGAPVEKVELKVDQRVLGYILTKPLHESQCSNPEPMEDGYWKVILKVKDNYELRSLLRSFGEQLEVLSPESLRIVMKESAEKLYNMYNKKK